MFVQNNEVVYVSKNEFDVGEYLRMYKLKKIGSGGFGVVYKGIH